MPRASVLDYSAVCTVVSVCISWHHAVLDDVLDAHISYPTSDNAVSAGTLDWGCTSSVAQPSSAATPATPSSACGSQLTETDTVGSDGSASGY